MKQQTQARTKRTVRTKRTKKWLKRSKETAVKRIAARKVKFLENLRGCGNVSVAAARSAIGRTALYDWRNADSKFAEQWKEAHELAFDDLEATMLERAKHGSDTLAIFLAKARWPHKYRDRIELDIKNSPVLRLIIMEVVKFMELYVPANDRRTIINRLYTIAGLHPPTESLTPPAANGTETVGAGDPAEGHNPERGSHG